MQPMSWLPCLVTAHQSSLGSNSIRSSASLDDLRDVNTDARDFKEPKILEQAWHAVAASRKLEEWDR